jgi:hypothetical protein
LALMTQSDIERLDAISDRLDKVRGAGAVDEALALVAALRSELRGRLTVDNSMSRPPPPPGINPDDLGQRTFTA